MVEQCGAYLGVFCDIFIGIGNLNAYLDVTLHYFNNNYGKIFICNFRVTLDYCS